MKKLSLQSLSLLAGFIIVVLVAICFFITGVSFKLSLLILPILFALFYIIVFFSIKNFIYNKIKLIYRTIYTLKSNQLNEAVSKTIIKNDPLSEVNQEVLKWADSKSKEIERLKGMSNYRKDFLGNVSHELKTPIFNIQGYIYTLLDGALENEELSKKFLNRAAKSADRLEILVNDLLTISELETENKNLKIEKFDIVELTKDIYESLEIRAKKHQIELGFKKSNYNPIYVWADKKQIQQVLVNLLDNSIKYGKIGGKTNVDFYDMDQNYLIEVSDNGEGIHKNHLPRLFERFYRTDKARSREHGGTGLGLAIVKHIIEAHQKTINVRSQLGVGTTFGFTLSVKKYEIQS